jgi:hypothetical protein
VVLSPDVLVRCIYHSIVGLVSILAYRAVFVFDQSACVWHGPQFVDCARTERTLRFYNFSELSWTNST